MSKLILDELIEAASALGHHEALRSSSDETIRYWRERVAELRGVLVWGEQIADVFYPTRISRDAAGEVAEERLAISQWPEWAQEALGWLSVKCPVCGLSPVNGRPAHMSSCSLGGYQPIAVPGPINPPPRKP